MGALVSQRSYLDSIHNIVWEPQIKQSVLIECPVFEVLFGGARGGGKSDGILGDFAVQLLDTSGWKLAMLFVYWKPNWHILVECVRQP